MSVDCLNLEDIWQKCFFVAMVASCQSIDNRKSICFRR